MKVVLFQKSYKCATVKQMLLSALPDQRDSDCAIVWCV